MRLNKEPPDDIPVVVFAGLAGTSPTLALSPRVAGGDRGAGVPLPTAPPAGGREEDEDLRKIKNSGALTEDDNCVVCLSRESGRRGGGAGNRGCGGGA